MSENPLDPSYDPETHREFYADLVRDRLRELLGDRYATRDKDSR